MNIYYKSIIQKNFNSFFLFTNILLLISMLIYRMGASVADVDIWHQMALARESVKLGYIPYTDLFSYTETISPSVHHEWGAGFISYFVVSLLNYDGIVFLRYMLIFALIVTLFLGLKSKGSNTHIILFLIPLPIYLVSYGTSAVRAQMYSFLFTALLLLFLDIDRKGERWWIIPWLFVYILWLNIHGGFLVGFGLTIIYCIEQFIRGKPSKHIATVVSLMILFIVVNPYGFHYYPYLLKAIVMKRPNISEWNSILSADLMQIGFFTVAIVLIIYTAIYCKYEDLNGLFLILSTAIVSIKAQRMLPFFAILWIFMIPAWIERTPLGKNIINVYKNRKKFLCIIFLIGTACFSLNILKVATWNLQIRNQLNHKWGSHIIYPVGAVEYLRSKNFNGNILVPFDWGAYVIWELYPQAKVSLDSRYEATYPIKVVDDQYNLFMGASNWKFLLLQYHPDIIITNNRLPLSKLIKSSNEWSLIYNDGIWEIFSISGITLS